MTIHPKRILSLVALFFASALILILAGQVLPAAADVPPLPMAPAADPDLIIESIEYSPENPGVGESVDITVTIKNQGDAATGTGFRTYLYIDPDTEPPETDTPDTSYTYHYGLNGGESYVWAYTDYTFETAGPHSIWAWVDRDDDISESDENNNQSHVTIGPDGDNYEPDNTCDQASSISTDGTVQNHELNPVGDVDWVKFEAIGGVRYVIDAANVGADADVILELHNVCGGPPGFGGGQHIEWVAPVDGTYYLKVYHHDTSYNALQSDYELSVAAQDDQCVGSYEPNDLCATSKDVPTDGTLQHHTFCQTGDADWLRFQGVAGTTYLIEATNPGPDADVILELHNSCTAPPGFGSGARIEWTCPVSGFYYVRALNHEASEYGADATYDLSITAQTDCQPDSFESDNTPATANSLTVDGDSQNHNICPAGDVDWARFNATAGLTYTLETLNPSAEADTYLCLYQSDGATQIACDDDSGAGKASRIIWEAPASGEYLLEVRHYQDDVAGVETQYELAARTGRCSEDSFEQDDVRSAAGSISTDGATQAHNICPAGDEDWVSFQADAGDYLIETSGLGPEADTVLALFDAGGNRLAVNDDYDGGLASRIAYQITSTGEYYVQVRHYDLTKFGSGTEYQVSVDTGTPPPTPSPTPTPTPTPSPTPPPDSGIKTLILVNRARFASVYGGSDADNLMSKLQELAADDAIQGEVLQIENNASVAAAYADWESDLTDTDKANAVAAAIRALAMGYVDSHADLEYIVVVGGDWVIPFRRVPDQTNHPESRYSSASRDTSVGAACEDDMNLTDDYYADREPTPWNGRELYVPDYAIGRLIETPDEIIGVVDTFLAGHEIGDVRALVTGYDFVQDAANEMCATYQGTLGSDKVDCTLIEDSWPGNDLKQKQLHADPPFRIQSINGHANHSTEGAPDGNNVSASDVAAATADLERAIIHTVGCHSGMNVPPENATEPLDLPQAFAQQKANYVANTGYGWGIRGDIGLSEKLMSKYATELVAGSSQTIGPALMEAKQQYYQEESNPSAYDEKILIESTLYGLPQYTLNIGATVRQRAVSDAFPSVNITTSLPAAFGGLQQGYVEIGLPAAFGTFDPTTTDEGSYYALDGFIHATVGEPIQPTFFAPLSSSAGPLRGAVLRSASYQDQVGFDPVIAAPTNEFFTETVEPDFASDGWYPPVPMTVRYSELATDTTSTLVTLMGQYDPRSGTERLFDQMELNLYYSTEADQEPAEVAAVGGIFDAAKNQAQFKVGTTDASGIHRVVVAYGEGDGQWQSTDLSWNATLQKWIGSIETASQDMLFYVQVVDKAGNVTVEANKGAYYSLGLGAVTEREPNYAYLPLILKE